MGGSVSSSFYWSSLFTEAVVVDCKISFSKSQWFAFDPSYEWSISDRKRLAIVQGRKSWKSCSVNSSFISCEKQSYESDAQFVERILNISPFFSSKNDAATWLHKVQSIRRKLEQKTLSEELLDNLIIYEDCIENAICIQDNSQISAAVRKIADQVDRSIPARNSHMSAQIQFKYNF